MRTELERHPAPIINFEGWFAELYRRIATAGSPDEINNALGLLRPYDNARWVLPARLPMAETIAAKRMRELRGSWASGKDRATGDVA